MAATKKALALAEDIASELKLRQTALPVSVSADTDGNPLVFLGTGVAGTKNTIFKVLNVVWPLAKDILGLESQVFTPHVIRVGFEAPTTTAAADTDPNTLQDKLLSLAVALSRGTRVEVYESAAGDSPDADDLIAGNLKASYEPSFQYGITNSQ